MLINVPDTLKFASGVPVTLTDAGSILQRLIFNHARPCASLVNKTDIDRVIQDLRESHIEASTAK